MWIKCGDITADVARGFGLAYHKIKADIIENSRSIKSQTTCYIL